MTLHQLKVFVSVVNHLNITKASRALRVSQPAVSQHVQRIQSDYGGKLIKKNGQGIELTERGRAFLTDVEGILSRLDALESKYATRHSKEAVEILNLGGSHGASAHLLPWLMARFRETHPATGMTLYTDTSETLEKMLTRAAIEIAIASKPKRPADFHMEPFRTEQFSAFVPAAHNLARIKKITVHDLAQLPLVVRTRNDGESRTEKILKRLDGIAVKAKIAMRYESFDAVKAAVKNGSGVGILHQDLIVEEVRRKEFAIVKVTGIDLTVKNYILYVKNKPLSVTAQEFLNLLREVRHPGKQGSKSTSGKFCPARNHSRDG